MKIAALPDCHVPFHSRKALALAIKVIKDFKPDVLVHMGDLVDFYAVSRFDKDPTKDRGLKHELVTVKHVLDRLDDLAPRKIFITGNHCERLEKYVLKNAPALAGIVSLDDVLGLKERGWEVYPYQEPAVIGKLSFVHDLGYAGVNSLRQTINAYPANLIMAHSHRFEYLVRGNLRRETMTIANFGWLGDPAQIDYLPSVKVKQDWSHGFGLIHLDNLGNPTIQGIPIKARKCMVNGKIYE